MIPVVEIQKITSLPRLTELSYDNSKVYHKVNTRPTSSTLRPKTTPPLLTLQRTHKLEQNHLALAAYLGLQHLEIHGAPLLRKARGQRRVRFESLGLLARPDKKPGSLPRVPLKERHHSLTTQNTEGEEGHDKLQ